MPLPEHWQFEAIGTYWDIATSAPLSGDTRQQVTKIIEMFDRTYSRFRPDSVLSRLSRDGGTYTFPSSMRFRDLFRLYQDLYHKTHGRMTPLVAQSLEALGYDAMYSLQKRKNIPRPPLLEDVVIDDTQESLSLRVPALLDFGAAGKGLLVDLVSACFEKERVEDFVIDASGDIMHHAAEPYIVGLEHPGDPRKVIGTILIEHEALCASAVNRRAWGNSHHIIDGKTGLPTENIIATWVVGPNCMTADGLATALFFCDEPDRLADQYDAAYLRIDRSGIIETNERMKARVELFS